MNETPRHPPPAPAVLRLMQGLVHGRWRATGETLFREVVGLAEIGVGSDVLVLGCGDGVTAYWLAARTGAVVTGVDEEPGRIERAERRRRESYPELPLSFERAPLSDLPHATGVFDATLVEPALAAASDPARALREVVRVTKPMRPIILMQPVWSGELPAATRRALVERLGLTPRHIVEWKQMLRDAGVVDIQVQDWNEAPARRSTAGAVAVSPPLGWQHKAQIVGRAWSRWGWRGVRGAVAREEALLRDLARERSLTFQLITGVKWPHARSE